MPKVRVTRTPQDKMISELMAENAQLRLANAALEAKLQERIELTETVLDLTARLDELRATENPMWRGVSPTWRVLIPREARASVALDHDPKAETQYKQKQTTHVLKEEYSVTARANDRARCPTCNKFSVGGQCAYCGVIR